VVKGVANDGVGTVVQRLERRYVAVSPHEHHRSAGEVVGQLRRRLAGGGGVVSGSSMFGSTQCLRKLLKKKFWRNFG
jgi:predicted DNA repair protein MutK